MRAYQGNTDRGVYDDDADPPDEQTKLDHDERREETFLQPRNAPWEQLFPTASVLTTYKPAPNVNRVTPLLAVSRLQATPKSDRNDAR